MWYTGSPCELQQRRSAHTYVVHGGQNAHMGLDLSVTRDPSFCRAELRGLQAAAFASPEECELVMKAVADGIRALGGAPPRERFLLLVHCAQELIYI